MPTRCSVCDECFNLSNHKKVNCPFCDFSSCTGCNERYLLDTTQDAHCMSCRKGWTRETLMNNFTAKFVTKTYKERRENLLLDRERSLMPETQPFVELEKERRGIDLQIEELHIKRRKCYEELNVHQQTTIQEIGRIWGIEDSTHSQIKWHDISQEHQKKVNNIDTDIRTKDWTQKFLLQIITSQKSAGLDKRKFVRACPHENCKGFLSTAWKCGLCDNWTCPDCHEVKGKDRDAAHVCDPNNIATAQLLAKDSRNCPSCASLIFKINGCDQMWCTQCHTAFSWRTGQIETHRIHNPHYYEYQRASGTIRREPGDVLCGGLPDWYSIRLNVANNSSTRQIIANAYRSHAHCQYALLPKYRVQQQNSNRDLRIQYMIGDIDEATFKKKIQQREKANQKKNDIYQVLEMYMTVIVDLFQAYQVSHDLQQLVDSLGGLREHYSTTIDKVKDCYKCAVPIVTHNFEMY